MTASNDRNAQICARARHGESHQDIAAAFGISRQRVDQIVKRATAGTAGEAQRAELARRYRAKYAELQKIIDSPPAKTTAIGKTVTDPDTGAIVRDQQVVVACIREQIKIEAAFRSMFSADINDTAPAVDARTQVYIDRINLGEQTYGHITPPALGLPPGVIPTEEDIDRAFDRFKNPADGSIFVPPSLIAEGRDSVWAYVANQAYRRGITRPAITAPADDDVVDAELVD